MLLKHQADTGVLGATETSSSSPFICRQVVHNVGLCIVLHDITSIGDSYLFPGDGSSHTPGKYGCKKFAN